MVNQTFGLLRVLRGLRRGARTAGAATAHAAVASRVARALGRSSRTHRPHRAAVERTAGASAATSALRVHARRDVWRSVRRGKASEKGDITTISARSALRGVLREASVFEPEGFSDSPSQAHRARAVRRFARACRARTLTSPTELNYLGGGTQTNTGGVPPKERKKQTNQAWCGPVWHLA